MTVERCAYCKQPMPTTKPRTCFDCGLQISIHHKWTWQERNEVNTCVHRHCDNPTSYRAPQSNGEAGDAA